MFVKVLHDDLLASDKLEFDLYSQEGRPLYEAGYTFADHELLELKRGSFYRHAHDLPKTDVFNHEDYLFRFKAGLTETEQRSASLEDEAEPLLSGEASCLFLGSIQHFWSRMRRGATPDIALCEVARDKLIAEVTTRVDQIQYLSQVRMRDEFTYSHILDVTALSIALAMKAGFSPKEVQEVALAAILHDLGKLLIPRDIMFKPSRLTEKEFQVMQLHPGLGYKIITEVLKLPEPIALPALQHQEMYGGGGYPYGLKGEEIHPYSHLVKIADVYDALTSKRPYKESIPSFKAVKIMLSEGDKSFHPVFLEHFVKLSNYHDFTREEAPTRKEMVS